MRQRRGGGKNCYIISYMVAVVVITKIKMKPIQKHGIKFKQEDNFFVWLNKLELLRAGHESKKYFEAARALSGFHTFIAKTCEKSTKFMGKYTIKKMCPAMTFIL